MANKNSALEKLRELCAQQFNNAESKEQIELSALFNDTINQLESEQQALIDEKKEVMSAYREAIRNTSFKQPLQEDYEEPQPRTIEEIAREILAKK